MGSERMAGIGPLVAVRQGNVPLLRDTTVDKSAGINRVGFNSCVLEASIGATSGAPTSFTSDFKLQHSDTDVDANYVDFVPGAAGSGAVTTLAAANSVGRKSINLDGAKAYVRVYHVNAFVAGTSPKVNTASQVLLGGAQVLPAESDS